MVSLVVTKHWFSTSSTMPAGCEADCDVKPRRSARRMVTSRCEKFSTVRARLFAGEAGEHIDQPFLVLRGERGAGGIEQDVFDAPQRIADLRLDHAARSLRPATRAVMRARRLF